jgi:hypothetical protein
MTTGGPSVAPRRKSRIPGPARWLVQTRRLAARVISGLEHRELPENERTWGEALHARLELSIAEAVAAAIPTDPRDHRRARKTPRPQLLDGVQ